MTDNYKLIMNLQSITNRLIYVNIVYFYYLVYIKLHYMLQYAAN